MHHILQQLYKGNENKNTSLPIDIQYILPEE